MAAALPCRRCDNWLVTPATLLSIGVNSLASTTTAAQDFLYGFDLDDADNRAHLTNGLSDILRLGIVAR